MGVDLNISFSDTAMTLEESTQPTKLAVYELHYPSGRIYTTTLLYDENTNLAER